MNLVGHVAVAARATAMPTAGYLAGAMLPDLAAIARVRLGPLDPTPEDRVAAAMAEGIAVHHASDAAFHASPWFGEHHRALRDTLLDAGVDRGAARACAHAGLEMLLDGHLMADAHIAHASDTAFAAVMTGGDACEAAVALASPEDRAAWRERLDQIGRSLDPASYRSAQSVALRLARMTRGRRRIELRVVHVDTVAHALEAYQPVVARDGERVLRDVTRAIADRQVTGGVGAGGSAVGAGVP